MSVINFDLITLLTGALGGGSIVGAAIKVVGQKAALNSNERTAQSKIAAGERKDTLDRLWEKNAYLEREQSDIHKRLDECQDQHRESKAAHKICEDKTSRLEGEIERIKRDIYDIQSESRSPTLLMAK